jgi:predicted RNA-binding Zn ribbon-like protein
MARATHLTAPDALALVQAYANTRSLAGPETLRAWLVRKGLLAEGEHVSSDDHARALVVRDAIRPLLQANEGEPLDPPTVAALNEMAAHLTLYTCFTPDGRGVLEPSASGVDATLTHILAAIVAAMADGTWARLKACHNPACQWVFYDESKNRSRLWCAMQACGNRNKVRAYKRRQRAAGAKGYSV